MKKSRSRTPSKRRATIAAGTSLLLATASIQAQSYQFYDVPAGETETISQNLTNVEGVNLQKSGDGTLILTGSNTYTGATEVVGGALNLSGTSASISHAGSSIFLTTGTLNIQNGASATTYDGNIGWLAGNVGALSVSGAGSTWENTGSVWVGASGTGTLTITDGGTVNTSSSAFIGGYAGSKGTVLLSGSGSSWSTNNFFLGDQGEGTVTVADGASLETGSTRIANQLGGSGSLLVTGSNTTWDSDALFVGAYGEGSVTIADGATAFTNGNTFLGETGNGTGTLTVTGTGSSYTATGVNWIGSNGTGTFNVLDGATVEVGQTFLGTSGSASGELNIAGAGSSYTTGSSAFYVGNNGTGVVTITNGGSLISSGTAFVGAGPDSGGTISISNGEWTHTGDFVLGNYGGGILTIEDGGTFTSSGVSTIAGGSDSNARVSITGTNSSWISTGDITLGDGSAFITLGDGGILRIDGDGAPGTGSLIFSGSSAQTLVIGGTSESTAAAAGTLQAATVMTTGSGSAMIAFNHTDENYLFSSNVSGKIYLVSSAGRTLLTGSSNVYGVGSTGGELTVSGSLAFVETEIFGALNGTIGVVDGAQVITGQLYVAGGTGNSAAIVSGSGSRLDAQVAYIGVEGGTGTIRVEDGAVVSVANETYLGLDAVGLATVTGTGSEWITGNRFVLGEGTIDFGNDPIDFAGQGILNISEGGLVRIDQNGPGLGTLVLSGTERSVLNIGGTPDSNALAAGTLDAALVTSGSIGGGSINFNHTGGESEGYAFTPTITGDITVNHFAGRTILASANSYTGDTIVYGGTLISGIQGAISSETYLTIAGSNAVVDLNGFAESVQSFALIDGGSLINGSIESFEDVALYDGYLSAVVSGDVNLQKVGSGSAVIENDQLYTGNTEVYGGRLNLIGSTISNSEVYGGTFIITGTAGGDLLVDGGKAVVNGRVDGDVIVLNGRLGGDGYIAQNLFNSGVVNPGNSPGTLTVGENYIQTSNGTFEVEIGSKKKYDRLVVSGTAFLDGTLAIVKSYRPKKDGEKYRIITADGGVVGEFSDVESVFNNTLRSFDVDYLSNAVVLEYSEGSFLDFAKEKNLSQNVRSVAKALDRANRHDKLGKLLDTLYDTQLSDLSNQLALLSPEAFAQIFQIGFATAQVQYGNLERRLSDVRDGAIGFSTNGLALSNSRGSLNYDGTPIVNTRDGLSLAGWDGKSVVGKQSVAPIVEQSRWGFFATGSGEWADVETTAQARGSEFSTGGFTLGADYRVSDNFVVGLAGGYANTGSDLNNGGKIDVNSGRGSAYASVFGNGFYLNTTVGGAYNSYDTKRGTVGGIARGDTSGGEFDALLGGGYDYRVGGFSVGPVASLQYTYIGLSSFTESGSSAPMHFPSQSQNSLKSSLGGKVSYAWNAGGVVIKPEVRAQWQHEFLDSTASVESSFAGGAGAFTVNGPNIGRDALLLDAGVAVQFSPTYSAFAYYTGEIGRSNYSSNAVNGGFRINF